ncbi:MAG: hypothetical protein LUG21_01100, partial [Clostridiales bacterium]|nr:hypothetical protein [Clostridiales bacterium]
YYVSFDENGIIKENSEINIYSNFLNASEAGQEIYFIIEITDKNLKQSNSFAEISISVNSIRYSIFGDNIVLTPKNSEDEASKSKATSGKTTKRNKSSNSEAADNSKAGKTTKFKYSGNNSGADNSAYKYSENSYEEINGNSDNNADESIVNGSSSVVEKKSKLSAQSKILIAAACIMALTAVILIIHSALKAKNNDSNSKDENGIIKNEEKIDDTDSEDYKLEE